MVDEAATTRDRILNVAEALFAARGFAGTPMRDIARAAELTPASLYNHFDGKQELYEAVLERGVRPLIELLQAMPTRDNTRENLDGLIQEIMAHLATRPHLPGLIQHEALNGGAALTRVSRSYVLPMIEQGVLGLKGEERSPWSEDEYPNVMFAWLHLVFGHFAMAPMYREVFGQDALSPEGIERQTRFLRKMADLMMTASGD
jgi:TetR/AcrR family transcriptional regulator